MTTRTCIVALALLTEACVSAGPKRPTGRAPADPIAGISGDALHARGLAFARAGDLVRAEQYLKAALAKGARDQIVSPQLVKVCVAASRLRAAIAYAEPYLERQPHDTGMRYLLATVHLSLGNAYQARIGFERVLTARPQTADAEFFLGIIAVDQFDFDRARGHFARYLEARPDGGHAAKARSLLAQRAPRTLTSVEVSP